MPSVAGLLLNSKLSMRSLLQSSRGYSLVEMMFVVAIAGTLMAIASPVMRDITEGAKLNSASREVERELQNARLKAVSTNRSLRVRLNCPTAGFFRTVEVLSTAADTASNRCLQTAYPFPADNDVMTRPNYDGPTRTLPAGATVALSDTTVYPLIEFHPNGTAATVTAAGSQTISAPVTVTVTRSNKSRTITINGAGKIQIQQ
jgi:prepilin-type N-terminal cleavage/methylation domain-containing protein